MRLINQNIKETAEQFKVNCPWFNNSYFTVKIITAICCSQVDLLNPDKSPETFGDKFFTETVGEPLQVSILISPLDVTK